jgi:hypothetical protein
MTNHSSPNFLSYGKVTALSVFAIFCIIAMSLCGCGSTESNHYDISSNGKQITIMENGDFSIGLLVNINTGAEWKIVEIDNNIAELKMPPTSMAQVITGGLQRLYYYNFIFRAKNAGQTVLKMSLLKPGEETPIDTFSATIVVK